jgi:hypothetical protein
MRVRLFGTGLGAFAMILAAGASAAPPTFRKVVLTDKFHAEAAGVGDIDKDGHGDAVYPAGIPQIVELIQGSASCPVYPVVKRSDERTITMAAYDNPRFVEDLVRDLSILCRDRGLPHSITARNIESIHSHDAVARLSWDPVGE